MHATMWHRWIALCGITLLALTACGPTGASSYAPSNDAASASATGAGAAMGGTDVLVGIWQSDPISATDVDTYLRESYTDHQIEEFHKGPCAPSDGHVAVKTLNFGAGQLVVSNATDNGPAREDWSGTYVVQDADTFLAGGDTPYITVDFRVQGDHLTLKLIEDRFPDHTPWHMAQDGIVLDIGKPLADTMCQTTIYDVSRYLRVG